MGEGGRRGSALACATAPDDVLNELFSASRVGGANGQGQGGAYARLCAREIVLTVAWRVTFDRRPECLEKPPMATRLYPALA
ncbi:hypothetical protein ACIQXA_36950 [Streptomyces massasporeus]|uniref:hypothetical protein n=1 Tax=Streptomyces massasporeus TaxID=67324 RepID=UPI003822596A